MAYSWPNVHVVEDNPRVPGVDTHLAYSDDGGSTWQFSGVLWASEPDVNRGGNGEPGFTDHEVPNILPRQTANGVIWYGIRLDYFIPNDGGFSRRPLDSFRLEIMQASSPTELATAPTATLGSALTASAWEVDFDLSSLSGDLARCAFWNEPALYYLNDQLYLAVRCLAIDMRTGRPEVSQSDIVVFATQPGDEVLAWKWRYVGVLAGHEDAQKLGANGLTQIDLAVGIDGQLLAILTPDDWDATLQDFVHLGCYLVEVGSIDPPALARDSTGDLRIRGVITASDQAPLGPGACAYDPASATGVILVRRTKATGTLVASMHQTMIRP